MRLITLTEARSAADARVANAPRMTVPEALGSPVAGGNRLSNRSIDIARPVRIAAGSGISARTAAGEAWRIQTRCIVIVLRRIGVVGLIVLRKRWRGGGDECERD